MNVRASRLVPHGLATLPVTARRVVAVFDLDGTLVDTAPDLSASLDHCLAHANLPPLPIGRLRPVAGRGTRAMLEAGYAAAGRPLGEDERLRQTERFLGYYGAHVADRSRPYPGAVAAMDRLARSGAILAVCTNKTETLARLLLDTLALSDRFAAVCGSDTFAARKPDPLHLLETVRRAGGDRADAVMIGDTDTDMEAARRAGVPSVLMLLGYDADQAAMAKAASRLPGFAELTPALLARLIARNVGVASDPTPF